MRAALVMVVIVVIGTASFVSSSRADVKLTGLKTDGIPVAYISIDGQITQADVAQFKELVSLLRSSVDVFEVDLNSPGGDVDAALAIARMVRSEWMWTVVDDGPNVICASACVYIFAAGAMRIAGDRSRIVIHRPYADPELFGRLDRKSAGRAYSDVTETIRAFLSTMGMSDSLFSEMMKVPSHKGRLLRFSELKAMNLIGEDPGYMEWTRARGIVKRGAARTR